MQFMLEARQVEIKQERQSKKKAKKDKILGELYSDTTSTYRIFSRAFCNFVFPEGIQRPLPKQSMDDVIVNQNQQTKQKTVDEDILDPI